METVDWANLNQASKAHPPNQFQPETISANLYGRNRKMGDSDQGSWHNDRLTRLAYTAYALDLTSTVSPILRSTINYLPLPACSDREYHKKYYMVSISSI